MIPPTSTPPDPLERLPAQQGGLLHLAVDSISNPFIVIHIEDYTVVYANDAVRYLSNHPDAATCYGLLYGRDKPCNLNPQECPIHIAQRNRQALVLEKKLPNRQGDLRLMETHVYPILDGSGKISFVVKYFVDITHRKQTEAALQQSRENLVQQNRQLLRLTQAVEQSANAIVITDLEGIIQYVNPQFSRVTGYTREEAIGQHTRILKSGDQEASFYRDLWSKITAGGMWSGEFHNRRKDGTFYWERASIAPVFDEAGKIINFIAVKEDITQLKEAQDALARYAAELEQEKRKSDRLLLNILPPSVASDLKETGATSPRTFHDVTALMADFVDFTAYSAGLSPEALIDELNDIFTTFDHIMEKHGCERIKTIGDAYLAVCGMSQATPQHARHMLHAAQDMRAYIRQRGQTKPHQWQIRIGLASGDIVGGVVGIDKFVFDVFGDTINMASRMETASAPMMITLAESTYRLVKNVAAFTQRTVPVHGKGEMNIYCLPESQTE